MHVLRRPVELTSDFSHSAGWLLAATFAHSNLLSWLSQIDLVGYLNEPIGGGARLSGIDLQL